VENALSEIAKLRSLRAIGLPPDLFAGYTPKLVERLRRRIAAESPSHIRQHPPAIRMTLLAALIFHLNASWQKSRAMWQPGSRRRCVRLG
jgi:hypothetical protein